MGGMVSGKAFSQFAGRFAEDRAEYRKVLLLFGYLFCVVSASTIGRTAADTLFLSRFDNGSLSAMYLPQAAVMIIAGLMFQKYASKVRLERLIVVLIPLISALVLISRIGAGLELRWVFPVIYIGYDVFNFLMVVCFWQFATSVMDQRKAKKMIGLVGSGGITGGIVSGFGLKALVPLVGTANLIFFYALLQLLGLAAVLLILRTSPETAEAVPAQARLGSSRQAKKRKAGLFASVPHLKYVAILSAVLVLSLTLIDYQFKVILRGTLQNEALAGFMGSFYGFSGLVALVFQLFVSGRILTRFGVMTSLLVFPVALIAGSFGILLLPLLAMAVVVKGSDKVIGDTLYSSVSQLVMFPVPPEWRGKAKGFLDGIVRNGAKGLAAICLLVVTRVLAPEQLSYVILLLLAVGVIAAIRVKKAYLSTLLANLRSGGDEDAHKAELNFMDPASRQILLEALSSPEKQQALYAFRILRGMEPPVLAPEHIRTLLRHPAAEVCLEALAYVELTVPEGFEPTLREYAASSHTSIRAKAILALAAYAKEGYLDEITDELDHAKVEIQAAAIAGLVKYYGIEGMFRAVGKLKHLIGSVHEEERVAMAALFGEIGVTSFYKPLIALLDDGSAQVRKQALQSAAKLRVPALVPLLVDRLQDSETRRHAIEALAAYGEAIIVPALQPDLGHKEIGLYLPPVFERIGTQTAFDTLLAAYETASFDMRDRVLESLLRMHKNELRTESKRIERYIGQELRLYVQFAEQASHVFGRDGYAEIEELVGEIRLGISRRIFQLLSFRYDGSTMQAVFSNWSEGDARQQANAAEVVDQTLQGSLRADMARMMAAPRTLSPVSSDETQFHQAVQWLSAQGDEWLGDMLRFIRSRLNRQGAAEESGVRPTAAARAANDAGYAGSAESDERLADHVSRVRLLRNVSLFQGLTNRDLSVIALRLQQVHVGQGNKIIQEGDPGDSMMILESGRAGVYRNGQLLQQLKRGDCFGEMAILTEGPRTATIIAEEDVLVWKLDSAVFYDMMFDQNSIALEMMKLLSRRLRAALNRSAVPEQERGDTSSGHAEAAAARSAQETAAVSSMKDDAILKRVLVLQKIDLFRHLSPDDFIWLAQMVDEVEYERGEVVCRTGEFGDAMYGIIEGAITVHRGNERIAELREGEFFGEMALIDSGPRSADCTAACDTVLLRLHRDQVMTYCFQNIDVLRSMMRVIADRLKHMG